MKKVLFFSLSFLLVFSSFGQGIGDFRVVVEDISFDDLPGLQSFAIAEYDGKWLIIGGRTDGLHRRQPWASFWEENNNKNIFVIDHVAQKVWSASLSELPTSIFEQLQSTNMVFEQKGETMYIMGGYGYAASEGMHLTHPFLTAVDIPQTIEAVVSGESLASNFRQIRDERMQVTGGYLRSIKDFFYLVGGQKFMGLYNPMGPDHGPGFIQEYTNQIRKFQILDDGEQLSITNYSTLTDSLELHRRDYNLAAQIFPDRSFGLTAFSGVFQYDVNLPWLNTVDIFEEGYKANQDFNQYLNQYHSAHLSAYDWESNDMYTLFFGGISRFFLNESGDLVDDQQVPFVRTISLVNRDAQGQMSESKIGEMPALLGSGAEFILNTGVELYENGVINLNKLSGEDILLGYVFGGIESSDSNIFFSNTGDQSVASNRLFAVRLIKGTTNVAEINSSVDDFSVFPNPNRGDRFTVSFQMNQKARISMDLLNGYGRILQREMIEEVFKPGKQEVKLRLNNKAPGIYYLRLYDGKCIQTRKIVKQ